MGGNRTLSGLFQEWDLAVEVYMKSPEVTNAYEPEYQRPRLMVTLKANPQPPPDGTSFVKKAFRARAMGQSAQHGIDSRSVYDARKHLAEVCRIRDEYAAATESPDETIALEAELADVAPEDSFEIDGD